jgi:hypothetical protein
VAKSYREIMRRRFRQRREIVGLQLAIWHVKSRRGDDSLTPQIYGFTARPLRRLCP